MREIVYLGIGSNRDNRLWYIFQAFRCFFQTPFIELLEISSIYETAPYGVTDQRDFLNGVIKVKTSFTPGRLLQCIKFIEKKVGRTNRGFWTSREIDIDILTYGSKVIQLPWLQIPHLELYKRRFVLIPFAEIASDFIVPKYDLSLQSLCEMCEDRGRVEQIISRSELEQQLLPISSQDKVLN